MKLIISFHLLFFLAVNYNYGSELDKPASKKMVLDSNIFKYYPLNVGNRWTWYIFRNFSPGSGYETALIVSTQIRSNHVYYKTRWDTYYFYNSQHYTEYRFHRIDSLTGNLYYLRIFNNDTSECISDSLNCTVNDSAYIYCMGNGQWYRYNTGTYNIFNQDFPVKNFMWSNYFEAWSEKKYALNIGHVYSIGQAVMSRTEYYLRGCIINGVHWGDTNVYLGINQISTEVPEKFSLSQNYPNPFNPATNIKFQIPKSEFVKIVVYDVLGKEVQTLVNKQLSPGTYEVDFDGSALPSGVYYYMLEAGEFNQTKKMVLIK